MWQMLRPVVQWPLYSPRRLLSVVVVLLVVVVAVQWATGQRTPTADPTPSGLATTPASSPAPTEPLDVTAWESGPVDGAEQVVRLAAAEVALAYLEAWGHPERPADQWLQGVAPYVTTRYFDALTTVDPANTQPLAVMGDTLEVAMFPGDSASIDVPTDRGTIRVRLHSSEAGVWLVDNMTPLG
jgi:hypothetical protein